jgi:hypothetical protein
MSLWAQKHTQYKYKPKRIILSMSESQSRYSIVERLTQMKLDIISEKLGLESDLKHKHQKVEQLKKELSDWESDIQQDTERNRRLKKREIEKANFESENAKERKNAKEIALNEKIEAIDKALERIEEISKTSPTIQTS